MKSASNQKSNNFKNEHSSFSNKWLKKQILEVVETILEFYLSSTISLQTIKN